MKILFFLSLGMLLIITNSVPISNSYVSISIKDRQIRFITNKIKKLNPKINNPENIATAIVYNSKKLKYDPLFTTAIIWVESRFNHKIMSKKSAIGLMQITKIAEQHVVQKVESIKKRPLEDIEYNIKIGLLYFDLLNKQYGCTKKALMAYNFGNIKNKNIPNITIKYSNKIHALSEDWNKEFRLYYNI